MKDSLKTTLKGSVLMDNPMYYDKIEIPFTEDVDFTFRAYGTSENPITIDGEGDITFSREHPSTHVVTPTELPFTQNSSYIFHFVGTGNTKLIIRRKYNLNTVFDLPVDAKQLIDTNIVELYTTRADNHPLRGDILAFASMPSLKYLYLTTTAMYGDIRSLENNTSIEALRLNSSLIKGNISALSKLTKLTVLSLRKGGVFGKLEDFVAGQIYNGRTTCSGIQWTSELKTEGSIEYKGEYDLLNNNNGTISWEPTGVTNQYLITFSYTQSGTAKTETETIRINADGTWSVV